VDPSHCATLRDHVQGGAESEPVSRRWCPFANPKPYSTEVAPATIPALCIAPCSLHVYTILCQLVAERLIVNLAARRRSAVTGCQRVAPRLPFGGTIAILVNKHVHGDKWMFVAFARARGGGGGGGGG